MPKPGVMFYFDVRPCLKRLSNEEKGLLFEAILDYGQYGVIPDFDGIMGIAWDFIQPRIEADDNHYQEVIEARRAAAKARWGKPPVQMHPNDAKADFAMQEMPTTKQPKDKTDSISKTAGGGLEGDNDEDRYARLEKQKHEMIEMLRSNL